MAFVLDESLFEGTFSDSEDCASQLTFGDTFCNGGATFNDVENTDPNLISASNISEPKKSSSGSTFDFPPRFTMCDPETKLGHCFLINNTFLKKNNEWVGHYRCSFHKEGCKKRPRF